MEELQANGSSTRMPLRQLSLLGLSKLLGSERSVPKPFTLEQMLQAVRKTRRWSKASQCTTAFFLMKRASMAEALSCLRLREAPVGIEPTNGGFADLCLTTWLRRRMLWDNNLAPGPQLTQGDTARPAPPEFSPANADDRLPLASRGQVEGCDGIVEGRDVADVRPQSSVPHPLDDLTQLGTI
jgi:hypothetical protein